MSDEPDIEAIADGLALWQEHKPQTAEDWLRIASRMDADGYETPNASPLFAALRLAVQERDSRAMQANMAEERVSELEVELRAALVLLAGHLPMDGKPRCAVDRETVAFLARHGRQR